MARSEELAGVERALLDLLAVEHGHFRYESGHHGDVWLDLDRLLVDARRLRSFASALAERARACRAEVVCGPLTGGAFIAQSVAAELDAGFAYGERIVGEDGYPSYRIPDSLRSPLHGRRVLLVDDAVNAGSALLATRADLLTCGAELVACASLIALGEAPARIAAKTNVPFHTLIALDRSLWQADACPLCASGQALVERVAR